MLSGKFAHWVIPAVLVFFAAPCGWGQFLSVSQDNVTLSSNSPGPVTVQIAAPNGTTVNLQASTTGGYPWLGLRAGSQTFNGVANAAATFTLPAVSSIDISAVLGNLKPGNYVALITLTSSTSSITISVTFNVTIGVVALMVAPKNIPFQYPGALSTQVNVTSIDPNNPNQATRVPVTMSVAYKTGSGWLNISSTSGMTPLTVTITLDLANLSAQNYQAYVTADGGAGVGNDIAVVSLAVQSLPANLSVSPPGPLNFTAQLGGQAPQAQTLSVTLTGGGSYQVVSTQPWLKVSASGSTVTVTVDPTGFATAGQYQGLITVTGPPGTLGSPANVSVTLTMQPAAPSLGVSPPGPLNFSYQLGGQAPQAQTLTVNLTGGGSYQVSSNQPWLKASASGSTVTVSIDPSGLTTAGQLQGAITVTGPAGTLNSPATVNVNLSVSGTVPVITDVQNGASFVSGIGPQSWVTVRGANLASTTRTWRSDEIVNGALPIMLDGVSVNIDGKAAYVYYISPTQLNVLSPADPATGPVPVKVTAGGAASAVFTTSLQTYSPALFTYFVNGTTRAAGVFPDGKIAGPTSLGPAYRPAVPGERLSFYATGLGPTTPQLPQGIVPPPGQFYNASTTTVLVNNVPVTADFAGITQFAGVYQINLVLPTGLPNGELPVMVQVNGVRSPSGLTMTVQN